MRGPQEQYWHHQGDLLEMEITEALSQMYWIREGVEIVISALKIGPPTGSIAQNRGPTN